MNLGLTNRNIKLYILHKISYVDEYIIIINLKVRSFLLLKLCMEILELACGLHDLSGYPKKNHRLFL